MRPVGIAIVLVALLTPLAGFGPLAMRHDPLAVFSEYVGAAALIAMALSQILATRLRILESLFGGLDRIYVLHKWLGIGAVAAILLHDTIDADIAGLGPETALSDLAETFGEIGLYGLLVLAIITVATFIPYRLWHATHKLMGAFFALALLHFAFIMKPFATLDPLGLYILGFGIAGVLSYLLTLMPRRWFSAGKVHHVTAIDRTGGALAVTLAPQHRRITHRAGQFAFVQFELPGRQESHPYTISSGPEGNGRLRFTIKGLGDHTRALEREVSVGTRAVVSGPFGRFYRTPGATCEVWIAGGIGVTPFVAWAQTLERDHPPVHLFVCARGRNRAPHLDELLAVCVADDRFKVHLIDSAAGERLTAERVADCVGVPLDGVQAYFCGPSSMGRALKCRLWALGLRSSAFHQEAFEIRSGIGMRRLVAWLLSLLPVPRDETPLTAVRSKAR